MPLWVLVSKLISPVFYRTNKFCSFTVSLCNLITINGFGHNDLYFDNHHLLQNSSCFKNSTLDSSQALLRQCSIFTDGETEVLKSYRTSQDYSEHIQDCNLHPHNPRPNLGFLPNHSCLRPAPSISAGPEWMLQGMEVAEK